MDANGTGGELRGRGVRPVTIAIWFVAVAIAISVPILSHPLLPLSDYINNLAGAYTVDAIGSDPALQRFYTIEWRIIPNLMMDLVVPVLHRFMSIYAAGQAFTVAALVLILSGTFALNRALFGRWSVLPVAAGILVYNEVLLVGVMNYIFGIGLSLWALAVWVALRERAWPWRMLASTLFVVALFFCHLYTVGLYGLGVLAFELHRLIMPPSRRPLGWRLLEFVAGGVPFLAAVGLLLASPVVDLAGDHHWEAAGKWNGLLLAFNVYENAVAALVIAASALALFWAIQRGRANMHPLGWALLLVGGILYLALPREIFSTHMADQRLPIALAFMLIATIDIDLRSPRARRVFAALFIVVFAVRLAEVQLTWDLLAHDSGGILRSVQSLPRGARILVVHADRTAYSHGTVSDFSLVHAVSIATIERSALVSGNFVVTGKHLLHVRPPFRRFVNLQDRIPPSADWLKAAAGTVDETDKFYWSQWHLHFDYVFVLFTPSGYANPDEQHLTLAGEGTGFQVYRVLRKI